LIILNRLSKIIKKLKYLCLNKGIPYVLRVTINFIRIKSKNNWYLYYYKLFKSRRTFVFQNKQYYYFYHEYNNTWKNERSIEIPILWDILKEHKGKEILEIGNVLSHYFEVDYDIVDKYEIAPNVINQDILDFNPARKYDLIIAISTLEHIGHDEIPKESQKFIKAIEKIKSLRKTDGIIIITFPIGLNPELDKAFYNGNIDFRNYYCFKRITGDNIWIETDCRKIKKSKINSPYSDANGLIIGFI